MGTFNSFSAGAVDSLEESDIRAGQGKHYRTQGRLDYVRKNLALRTAVVRSIDRFVIRCQVLQHMKDAFRINLEDRGDLIRRLAGCGAKLCGHLSLQFQDFRRCLLPVPPPAGGTH